MRIQSCHLPQRVYSSTLMEVLVVMTAAWACLLPLAVTSAAQTTFILRPEDLLAEDGSLLVRSGSTHDPCTTPEGVQGTCHSATTCPRFSQLLDHLHNNTVLDYFRQRVCSLGQGFVHVCCPLTPTPQSLPIFIVGPGRSSGGALSPSARPNARRPSQSVFQEDSSDDEDETREFLNPLPPPFTAQPIFLPPGPPRTFPQRPPAPQLTTTPVPRGTTTPTVGVGVFSGPDREPPTPVASVPSFLTPNIPFQRPTEPPEPSILPAEGECGIMGKGTTRSAPWVVGLGVLEQVEFRVTCWGALVSALHVIAAAHCLQGSIPSHVRLGDLRQPEKTVDVSLDSWVSDGYDSKTRQNDLALITLATSVTFSDNIRPVCLPFRYRFDGLRGQLLSVVGADDGGNLETRKVEVLGTEECNTVYGSRSLIANNNVALFSDPSISPSSSSTQTLISPRSSVITVDRRHICGTSISSASATSCLSDFGAPIIFHDEETTGLHFLAGVSSLDRTCQAGPGLYTRVGAFIPWLSQQLTKVALPRPSPVPNVASARRISFAGPSRG